MIWGRQDPHIDRLGRKRILNAMMEADVTFSWHEYNGQHAFMRDEGCAAPHPSKTHVGNAPGSLLMAPPAMCAWGLKGRIAPCTDGVHVQVPLRRRAGDGMLHQSGACCAA
jgi:hypothetical protein